MIGKWLVFVSLFAFKTIASPIYGGGSLSDNTDSKLEDLCTLSYVQSSLPANGTLLGIELIPSSVVVNVANASSHRYCNITASYTHTGKGDNVVLNYVFPDPSDFENRFYVAGGFGFTLSRSTTGGLDYGAVGGCTDAGYDAFSQTYDEVVLYGNGSINWDATYMFAYQALSELTTVGKPFARTFYNISDSEKIYTYFEGCSEGMSQVQRYGDLYDGVVVGAPAFRFAQQQVNHLFSSMVEQTLDYLPPPCELSKIVNATIAACDSLDGRTDGVISRTDLCMLEFNLSSLIGEAYHCDAQNHTSLGFGFSKRDVENTSYEPEQNGTVTEDGVAVAQAIYNGLHDSKGQRAYLSFQIGSELSDGETNYDENSSWDLNIPSTGGEYVAKFIQLLDIDNLSSLDNMTYDTLVDFMTTG